MPQFITHSIALRNDAVNILASNLEASRISVLELYLILHVIKLNLNWMF